MTHCQIVGLVGLDCPSRGVVQVRLGPPVAVVPFVKSQVAILLPELIDQNKIGA